MLWINPGNTFVVDLSNPSAFLLPCAQLFVSKQGRSALFLICISRSCPNYFWDLREKTLVLIKHCIIKTKGMNKTHLIMHCLLDLYLVWIVFHVAL